MTSTQQITGAGPHGLTGPLPAAGALQKDGLLAFLLAASALGAVLQITMGGVVRVTGSGLGCPDWPLCQGSIVPVFRDYHVALEWSHRLTGTVVGLTLVAATLRAWLHRPRDLTAAWATTAALVLIGIVGGIGGTVVLTELDPALRTLHLGLAEGVVLLAAYAWVTASYQPGPAATPDRQGASRLAVIAAVAVLAGLLSGSYAVWRGAGAVCPSWPLCGGPLVPDNTLTQLHLAHRLLAVAGAALALWAAHRAYRLPGAPGMLRWAALGALGLVVAQVLIGAANPWSDFDQWARALHLTAGTLFWLATVVVALLIYRPLPRQRGETGAPPA